MSAIAMGSTEVGVVAVLRPLVDVPAVLAALQAQGRHVGHRLRHGSAVSLLVQGSLLCWLCCRHMAGQ